MTEYTVDFFGGYPLDGAVVPKYQYAVVESHSDFGSRYIAIVNAESPEGVLAILESDCIPVKSVRSIVEGYSWPRSEYEAHEWRGTVLYRELADEPRRSLWRAVADYFSYPAPESRHG